MTPEYYEGCSAGGSGKRKASALESVCSSVRCEGVKDGMGQGEVLWRVYPKLGEKGIYSEGAQRAYSIDDPLDLVTSFQNAPYGKK